MISKIELCNFKLHKHSLISLKGLTILTGLNGMGKSSIIQSLLLLRQSFQTSDLDEGLNLKGYLCELGTAGELECQSSDSHQLKIDLSFDDKESLCYQFVYPNSSIQDTFLKGDSANVVSKQMLQGYSLFNSDFQYLSAFRLGPQKTYTRDTALVNSKKQISKVMGQCEYTIHFLDANKNMPLPISQLAIKNDGSDFVESDYFLSEQVDEWMDRISPHIKIYIDTIGEDFKLNYKFTRDKNMMTDSISALNTGFGISYVLPILVAVLSAKPGSLIIIENPEAHIHPKAQAILMELFAKAVDNGVQIILETHSDHVVNGALVALKKKMIGIDNLSVYFFERDETQHVSQPIELNITETGKIKRPPKGFFDQIDIDLRTITGF